MWRIVDFYKELKQRPCGRADGFIELKERGVITFYFADADE